jgi:hypothetical protein
MLELIFFLVGIAAGYNLKHNPKVIVKDASLAERLAVAENLNVSLKQDLAQVKEELWNIKHQQKVF